ncbi:MAG: TonB-dependent receptor [Emcibacter sp.]|nr:TonB-dependent receptor [Emcibacter sp.]
MKKHLSHNLLSSISLGSILLTAGAGQAVYAADESFMLEEITVTARKTSESLQSVPVAVTAFNAADLAVRGISDITELQQQIPNTTLQTSRGTNSTLTAFIRGIGQQDPLWGFEPGVGIYVDDVYFARPQGAVLEILDVERIEVLRGPQGTLYGKNTIGGALKYVTKKMDGEGELYLEGQYGTYNALNFKATGHAPIVEDKFYIGFGFATLNRDGFGKFINKNNAENYNKKLVSGRLTMEFTPSESLFIRIAGDITDDDSNARGGHRLTTSVFTADAPLDDVYDTLAGMDTTNEVQSKGLSLIVEYDLNESLTAKSITSYREGSTLTNIDFDNTAFNSVDVPALYDDNQFTQELQLNYNSDRFNMVGGLYYYQGDACGKFGVILGGFGITLENGGCVDTKSFSAYAQGSYDLTDKLSVSMGGRYTHDKKTANVYRFVYLGSVFPTEPVNVPPTAVPFAVQSDFDGEKSWNKFTPHIGLDYQINDDIMTYAKFSTGFKSGGFDMRGNKAANPSADQPYDPESVDTYEIGLKSELLDGRARINIALFYNDYKDMQVTVQRSINNGASFASQVLNAANAEMKGVEVEAIFAVTEELTLNATMGYIDASFKDVIFFNSDTQQSEDVSDLWSISNTPDFSSNVSLTYRTEVSEWDMIATANWAYRSDTQIFEVPSMLDMGSYSLFNAGITFISPDGGWTIGVHGKNILNKKYRIAGYNFADLGGEETIVGYYGDPATVTATVGIRF